MNPERTQTPENEGIVEVLLAAGGGSAAAALSAVESEPINILLVDDEPKNLTAIETVLDNPGYRLVRAGSANEALLALVAEEFALLVLDIQMPEMNGFELATMIKQRKKTATVPIIFLTAYFSQDEHVMEGYQTGAVDYLHKPINAAVLRSKVAVFAELHRKTRQSELANKALLAEIAERRRAQEELRSLNADLEHRVAERTAELSESEARFRAVAETLEEADRRKDEFLAMLGHELRNPLAAIRHAVRICEDSLDDSAARQWAGGVIDRQSAQLSRMVDDLLDVERINRGRIELRLEPLDLGGVLGRAVDAVRPLLEQKEHQLVAEIPKGELPVRGDAVRLEQVFVNLLGNAVKYTPARGCIRIEARREKGEAVVSIIDNGSGIPPHFLPHIFELFSQGQTSLDRSQGGLGIGLTIVRSLTEMHGGRVEVQSGGKVPGSTFTVRLPLLREPWHNGVTRPDSHCDELSSALRVLIVDDHVDTAQSLAMLLSRRNCNIRVAHDGPAGIALAEEFRPDVFLLDLGLPGLDGYEVVAALRADPRFREALFIAISGYAQESDRVRSLQAGFDHHCAKPVDFPALVSVIGSKFSGVRT